MIVFFIFTPILLIFMLYTYIKLYSDLKKIIIKNKAESKEEEINQILEDLNKELPLIMHTSNKNLHNNHEVLHK